MFVFLFICILAYLKTKHKYTNLQFKRKRNKIQESLNTAGDPISAAVVYCCNKQKIHIGTKGTQINH